MVIFHTMQGTCLVSLFGQLHLVKFLFSSKLNSFVKHELGHSYYDKYARMILFCPLLAVLPASANVAYVVKYYK